MTAPREHAMADALDHYRAGRMDQAEAVWQAMLARDPRDADALHLLGVAADAQGDPARGADLIRQALALRDVPRYHANLGMVLGHLNRHAEALDHLGRALTIRPDYPEALNNLGVSLAALRRLPEAEAAYRRAIAARPAWSDPLGNLGNTLREMGRLDEALIAYQQAVACNPASSEAQLGHALAHANLGQVLLQLGRFEDAAAACERALVLDPNHPAALASHGHALRELGRLTESEAVLRRALARRPGEANGYNNLALTLQAQDRPHEALAVLDLAAALDPDDAEIGHHRAMMTLRQGRLTEGWALYETRFRIRQAGNTYTAFAGRQAWQGEPLDGRTILLAPEQGLGDSIQFARYASLAARRGGRVVLGVQRPLARLFRTLAGVEQLIATGDPLPRYDVYCPLLSLPGIFGTTLDSVPGQAAYLSAEPELVAHWASRLAAPGLRVGIVWAGNPAHPGDRRRSLPAALLAPLWDVPGVRWFSLQVGPRAADVPDGVGDLSDKLTDFAETAAAVMALDLVVTVDTSVAHLAGALGRPVWLLLPATPDWRWLRHGDTSPWYPTMRLFRQATDGTWPPVVAGVATALRRWPGMPAGQSMS